ncbi:hypothetical protein ANO11243_043870 [Dothideomycetidae sp. 11243]|nr:hypothetical protein ANO11243_043870 [fungal sp. No.11243]
MDRRAQQSVRGGLEVLRVRVAISETTSRVHVTPRGCILKRPRRLWSIVQCSGLVSCRSTSDNRISAPQVTLRVLLRSAWVRRAPCAVMTMATTFQNAIVLSSSSPGRALDSDQGPTLRSRSRSASSSPYFQDAIESGSLSANNADKRHANESDATTNVAPPSRRKSTAKTKSKPGTIGASAVVPIEKPLRQPSRKKTTKAREVADNPDTVAGGAGAEEVSRHFGQASTVSGKEPADQASKDGCGQGSAMVTALSRRRSWTPVLGEQLRPMTGAAPDGSPAQDVENTAFQQMVTSFEFQEEQPIVNNAAPRPRATVSRKRKLDTTADGPARKRKTAAERKASAAKKTKEPKTKKVKEPKAVKVKEPKPKKIVRPKTVTDFAISAYRKATAEEDAQFTRPVTTFFQPTSTQIVPIEGDPTNVLEPESKKRKRTNPVLQFQFPPPEKAQHKMRDQDFLFGTSSQLANDDSPRTHRIMQQVIEESEHLAFASQTRSEDLERSPTSRLRVVNAPHGTSLSVGPGESNLWSVAARDADLRMFVASQKAMEARLADVPSSPPPDSGPEAQNDETTATRIEEPAVETLTQRQMVENSERLLIEDAGPFLELAATDAPNPESDDTRHDSGFVDISVVEQAQQAWKIEGQKHEADAVKHDQVHDKSQSDFIPTIHRPALQVLDVNTPAGKPEPVAGLKLAPTVNMASPAKRSPTKSKAAIEVIKRPRGRPRKDATEPPAAAAAKKPKPTTTKKPKSPPPAKKPSPSTPKRKKVSRPKSPTSATAQAQPASSSWQDIDEISDSEPHASPPSPARSTGAPSPVQQLQLSPSTTPQEKTEHETLFRTITRIVKSAPRGRIAQPSWYEKMLLYDPVVLEDLTAWLVAQGVRPDGTVQALPVPTVVIEEGEEESATGEKRKGKTKGKGKAKDKEKVLDKSLVLQPWVVQRWCEANSVCCLWKAGLRGGVRARY